MSLSQDQCTFVDTLAQLIAGAPEVLGFNRVKIVSMLRTVAEEAAEIAAGRSQLKDPNASAHVQGRAADLAIIAPDDAYISDGEAYRSLGERWEVMGGRWGGRFGVEPEDYGRKIGWDPDHFEWPRSET